MSVGTKRASNIDHSLADQASVADAVRGAYESGRPVYPVGGGTALDYGSGRADDGDRLELSRLDRIVDYTPRDMTILVEAGMRMADLAATLAKENQHLPIDVPRAADATIGGVVATNWSGPRRYGHGTIRDYVIGIRAVDGRGVAFQGGGRVVKNVAGYDFCKLLTGSLGTLGVITQLALKVTPRPETALAIVATCDLLAEADQLMARLINLPAAPVAIDLLAGPGWKLDTETRDAPSAIRNPQSEASHASATIVVRVEGTEVETSWLAEQVQYELWNGGGSGVAVLAPAEAEALWSRQVEFSDRGAGEMADDSPMVLKIAVPSSGVARFVADLLEIDPHCSIQAHAANGIIVVRFATFGHSDLTKVLVGRLRPAAVNAGGSLTIVSSKLEGLTPHLIWGGRTDAVALLERVKQKFDPRNILNRGRFAYH